MVFEEDFFEDSEEASNELSQALSNAIDQDVELLGVFIGVYDDLDDKRSLEDTVDQISGLYLTLGKYEKTILPVADRVLILTLSILKGKIESISNQKWDDLQISSLIDYYKDKTSSLKSDDSVSLENISSLVEILDQESLSYIFEDSLNSFKVTKSSYVHIHKLFTSLIEYKIAKERDIYFSDMIESFDSIRNSVLWSIDNLVRKDDGTTDLRSVGSRSRFKELFFKISLYFSLFDSVLDEDFAKEEWIKKVDDRSDSVMHKFLTHFDSFRNINSLNVSSHSSIHPYLMIYVNRALKRKNKPFVFFQTVKSSDKDFNIYFYNRIHDLSYQRPEFVGVHKEYLKNYYEVEYRRHLMELADSSGRDVKKLNIIYNSILEKLIKALNYRDESSLSIKELRNLNHSSKVFKQIDTEYISHDNQIFSKDYCSELDICNVKVLTAGIYTVPFDNIINKSIELDGKELVFTPLSMIYAPGGNVTLDFQGIYNPWVDTSGLNGEQYGYSQQDAVITFPHITIVKNNYTSPGPNGFYNKGFSFDYQLKGLANSVQDQPYHHILDGLNAGEIRLDLDSRSNLFGLPLLVSRGGNGADGKKGLSSIPGKKSVFTGPILLSSGVKFPISRTLDSFSRDGYVGAFESVLQYERKGLTCISKNSMSYEAVAASNINRNNCVSYLDYFIGNFKEFYQTNVVPSFNHGETFHKSHLEQSSKRIYFLKGRGGPGGNGGLGRRILFQGTNQDTQYLLYNNLVVGGQAGEGGIAGSCGYGNPSDFKGVSGRPGDIL